MPKLRVLSGEDLLRIFSQFGFEPHGQRGSHVKLRRYWQGQKQTLTVPVHREVDRGTLTTIYRQALRYLSESQLQQYFYTDTGRG